MLTHDLDPIWTGKPLIVPAKEDESEALMANVWSTPRREVPMATPKLDFRHGIAFELASVPEVQAVFTSEFGRVFFVWAVVPERNMGVYRRVHEQEKRIIQSHDNIQFDFTIMPSHGHDPKSLITDPSARLAYLRT